LSAQDLPELSIFFSVTSALISLGSIIIGVFSIWTHQTKTQANFVSYSITQPTSQVHLPLQFTYLHNAKHSYFGILGHAIMLSLPAVLLVWAILTFTISLVIFAMQPGVQDAQLVTRVSAWATLGVLCILLVAVISALYTFSMVWRFRQRTKTLFNRVKNVWSTCLYV
jgi:hypothetical protein